MKPMLLHEAPYYQSEINNQSYLFIQPKLNGWRAIINTKTGIIYSRTEKKIILPHITADVINKGLPEWIDGELYTHGYTLSEIQSMIKRKDERIKFNCFDVIDKGVFSSRFKVNYNNVETYRIMPSEINRYYKEFLSRGYEGAVIRLDREYEHGRSLNIFKLKPVYD